MDTTSILSALRAERDRINQAIDALETLGGTAPGTHSSQTQAAPSSRGGKRKLSAAARKRISEASKRRWARQKAQAAKPQASAKQAAPKPTAPKRGMSAAGRKRISEMMKKRWAARKKAAAKAA
jgi:hypothetical protein